MLRPKRRKLEHLGRGASQGARSNFHRRPIGSARENALRGETFPLPDTLTQVGDSARIGSSSVAGLMNEELDPSRGNRSRPDKGSSPGDVEIDRGRPGRRHDVGRVSIASYSDGRSSTLK
jgi:hypothetical protein